jgi:hypothetical protein
MQPSFVVVAAEPTRPWFPVIVVRRDADAWRRRARDARPMTVLWFIVWLIANNVGGHEPLLLDPVNAWTGTLLAAIALDLARAHAGRARG